MHLSVPISIILVLAASMLTYAAPFGASRTFPDIEQRSPAPLFEPRAERAQLLQSRSDPHPPPVPHPQHVTGTSGTRNDCNPLSTRSLREERQVHIITRPLEDSGGSFLPWLTHWAVLVGSHYYEIIPTDNNIPNACSGSLHGSHIRLNVGSVPLDRTWTFMEPRGLTAFSDAEIHSAAQAVVDEMAAHDYNIFTNNCQGFATRLVDRLNRRTRPCMIY
jgi:hypothetical protein